MPGRLRREPARRPTRTAAELYPVAKAKASETGVMGRWIAYLCERASAKVAHRQSFPEHALQKPNTCGRVRAFGDRLRGGECRDQLSGQGPDLGLLSHR